MGGECPANYTPPSSAVYYFMNFGQGKRSKRRKEVGESEKNLGRGDGAGCRVGVQTKGGDD